MTMRSVLAYFKQFSPSAVERKRTFERIRRTRFWGHSDSVSGEGSSLDATEEVRTKLPLLLREYGVKKFLDVPCGDFHWMKHVDMQGIDYIGGDLLDSLVQSNREKYQNAACRFEVVDLCIGPLPKADMIMVRDCLGHLSESDIRRALVVLKSSHVEWILLTHFTHRTDNMDIVTGYWRPINWTLRPYFFPPPRQLIEDRWADGGKIYTYKSLALWHRDDLPAWE